MLVDFPHIIVSQKREITDSLMDLSRTFAVDEQFYNEMTQEYSETITRQEDLLRKLMVLDVDFSKKVEMLQKLKEEQRHLEDQVMHFVIRNVPAQLVIDCQETCRTSRFSRI